MTLEICTGEEENQIQKSRHHVDDPNKTSEISLSMSSPSDQPSQNGGVSPIPMIPGPRIRSHGSVSVIGRRKEMEDSVRVRLGFVETRGGYDFFGVYDGHGGGQVSKMCGERFHGLVAAAVESGGGAIDWEEVMVESFRRMDCEVTGVQAVRTVGSAVVVAVVGEKVVVVANCGDCRAVLCRGGVAIALSDDHKPDRPDELRRVEAAGRKVINWNGHRVVGVLSTSRSIGDEYLKPFVTSEPEVRVTNRTSADEFLILASDGLWDVVSNEFACQVVRRCLRGRMRRKQLEGIEADVNRAGEAAAVLVELAMARGSSDNISVIVVELNRRSKIS